MTKKKKTISEDLSKLDKIVEWFETREEVDVEAGLDKIKQGVRLIKELKGKLKKVENEFKGIKEELNESTQ